MVIAGVVAAAAVVSAGVSVAGAVSGGGGAAGGGSGGGGGLSVQQMQYAYNGPHPSTTPLQGMQAPKADVLAAPRAGLARAATAGELRTTPSQAIGMDQAHSDYNNIWADRLSKYLDYNTRSLG